MLLDGRVDVPVLQLGADGIGVVVAGHQNRTGLTVEFQREISPHGHLVVGAENGVNRTVGLQQTHGGAHGVGGVPVGGFAGCQENSLADAQALEKSGPAVIGVHGAADAVQQDYAAFARQAVPHIGPDQCGAAAVVGPHIRNVDALFGQRLGIQRVVDVDHHNAPGDGFGAHRYQLTGVCRRDDDGRVVP